MLEATKQTPMSNEYVNIMTQEMSPVTMADILNFQSKFLSPLQTRSYIYICVCVEERIKLLCLLKIKILYKKNKPKIKKRRYMKYFGYILTFINHTVH